MQLLANYKYYNVAQCLNSLSAKFYDNIRTKDIHLGLKIWWGGF